MFKSFTLIVCTYMRPQPLLKLLRSVSNQTLYPSEIIIVDGSSNQETEQTLKDNHFKNLRYVQVEEEDRGLTKQRNYGVGLVSSVSEIVCFLDDDTVLTPSYFEKLIGTYNTKMEAAAIGGYIINEVKWESATSVKATNKNKFYFDGWMRNEPSRFKMRRVFGLLPDTKPGFLPTFAHGRSVSFLPPSGKIYQVEQLMGGASSYKMEVFKAMSFSPYFEGYGLYEDADFSIRLAKLGEVFINTEAQLHHYHDTSGRPNQYRYGKMVVRNGWYVWRVKYPNPSLKARLKWNATALLLSGIRFTNAWTSKNKKEALTESCGRMVGWLSLLFNAPKLD